MWGVLFRIQRLNLSTAGNHQVFHPPGKHFCSDTDAAAGAAAEAAARAAGCVAAASAVFIYYVVIIGHKFQKIVWCVNRRVKGCLLCRIPAK